MVYLRINRSISVSGSSERGLSVTDEGVILDKDEDVDPGYAVLLCALIVPRGGGILETGVCGLDED